MRVNRSNLLLILILILSLCGQSFAQADLLDRVPELQETARKSTGGALGCGRGSIRLITSRGEITLGVSLDPVHVFGKTITVADLLTLLNARVESNLSGVQNPMSGNVSSLGFVILSTLGASKDPNVIPVISKLLDDKDETIRAWAAISLFRLAESSEDLRSAITTIPFPKAALQGASGRGVKSPDWVMVKE